MARHVLKEPRQMSTHRRVLALLAAVLAWGSAQRANAQTLPTTTSVALTTANPVTHQIPRTGFRTNDQINFADCRDGDVMNFTLTLSANHNSYGLEVWAGTGCQTDSTRQTPTLTSCWKLYAGSPTTTLPTVSINVRDLLYGPTVLHSGSTSASGGTGSGGTGGTAGSDAGGTAGTGGTTAAGGTSSNTPIIPTGTIVTGTDASTCDDPTGLPVISQLQVYFMLVDGGGIAQGTIATYTVKYKLHAPNPPDNLSADIGDGLLPLHFSYAGNQSTDTTINGYQFFCDPPPGEAALADAGIVPSDAGLAATTCTPSKALVPSTRPDTKYSCGSASVSATAGNATGLVNGVAYNVAVAATDTYQNVGTISALACNTPQPVTGFYKAYRAAGGQGGGGFCSFSMQRETMPLLSLIGLASCLLLRRRRAA